jgi:hypothetical protein
MILRMNLGSRPNSFISIPRHPSKFFPIISRASSFQRISPVFLLTTAMPFLNFSVLLEGGFVENEKVSFTCLLLETEFIKLLHNGQVPS